MREDREGKGLEWADEGLDGVWRVGWMSEWMMSVLYPFCERCSIRQT